MKTEFKGTKGEWEIDRYDCVLSENGSTLFYPDTRGNEQVIKANAQLISKAPEMLEMLKEMVKELEFHGFHSSKTTNEARELIKEATTI